LHIFTKLGKKWNLFKIKFSKLLFYVLWNVLNNISDIFFFGKYHTWHF
jgi:hypothetical protein